MRRELELFMIIGGAGIAAIIGATMILRLDTIVGIGAVLTAGAGHDPGDALSALLMGVPLYGSIVALLCAMVLYGWLVWKPRWNNGGVHSRVFSKTNRSIVIVGNLGMIIVVSLGANISVPATCRHVGSFLSTKLQSIEVYMSSIGWYFLFLAGVTFLCGFLVGLLGMVAGNLSGGLFGTIAGILMSRARR